MILLMALLAGLSVGCGVWLLLQRRLLQLLIGIVVLGHGANLVIIGVAGGKRVSAPLLGPNGEIPADVADPLPQALILTAIVIGFGILAFATALAWRLHRETGHDDLVRMGEEA